MRVFTTILLLVYATTAFAGSGKVRKSKNAIKDEYIVVLRDDLDPKEVDKKAKDLTDAHSAKLDRVWKHALKGFSATMTEQRAEALQRHPDVLYVEENAEIFLSASMPTNVDPATCDLPTQQNCAAETDNRLWHLDRLEQSSAVPTHTFNYCSDGDGVTVYVVDTGVVAQHSEFLEPNGSSRVVAGYNATPDGYPANDPCLGGFVEPAEGPYDTRENFYYRQEVYTGGHGTAVASILGGRKVGVAKKVRIVPVKVIRCDTYNPRYHERNRDYLTGAMVFEVNGSGQVSGIYRAIAGGRTAATGPVFPSQNGQTVADGTVTWQKMADPPANSTAILVSGLDWILGPNNPNPRSPAVVTLSTFRFIDDEDVFDSDTPATRRSLEEATRSLIANNITVVASANNQNDDACLTSPANFSRTNPDPALRSKVITAGGTMILNNPDRIDPAEVPLVEQADGRGSNSTGQTEPPYQPAQPTRDARWVCGAGDSDNCLAPGQAGSNGGPCVTIFAPARNMSVAGIVGPNDYRDPRRKDALASGTSWSAPFVAGVVARILQRSPAGATVDQVYNTLRANSYVDELDPTTLNPPNLSGTPNVLVHLGDVLITDQPDSSPTSAASPAVLSVTATADLTPTYQWFQVNSGFDLYQYKRGAAASTPIAGATSATLTVNPAARTGYWVRVTNCGTFDSDIAVVVPTPPAPSGLVAAYNPATGRVQLSWNGSANAENYQLERKVGTGSWTWFTEIENLTGATVPTSLTDDSPPSGATVLYRVRAGAGELYLPGGQHTYSAFSNVDYANTRLPSDPTLTPLVTAIRAVHITELRAAVNQLYDGLGQSPPFADADALPASLVGQVVDDGHLTALMNAINAARSHPDVGLPAATFGTTPAANQPILAAQIENLRNALQ